MQRLLLLNTNRIKKTVQIYYFLLKKISEPTDATTMKSHIDRAIARNIGYIYITDDSPTGSDGDPWNSLPSYWQKQVDYISSLSR